MNLSVQQGAVFFQRGATRRSTSRPAWMCGAVATTFLLGTGLTDHALLRVLLLLAALPAVVGLALLSPASLVLLLATWLAVLGLVRRLVDSAAGTVSSGFGDPLLLVGPIVLVVLAAVAVQRGAFRDLSRLAKAVLVLSVLCVVEVGNPLQGNVLTGIAGLLFFLVPMLAFWVGRSLLGEAELRRLLGLVVALALAVAVYGLVQQYGGFPSWDTSWIDHSGYTALNVGGVIRSFGTMSSAAEYAAFLGIGVVVCAASLMRLTIAPLALIVGALLAFAMFEDSSRGVVVLAVAAGALMWAARRRLPVGAAVGVGALGLIALVLGVGHAAGGSGGNALVQHQVQGLANPFNSADSTLPGHFSGMLTGLKSAFLDPFGHGTGSVSIAASRFGGTGAGTEVDPSNVGVAFGLVGFGAFLVVVVDGLGAAYQYATVERSWWALAAFGVLVVTFLQWTNGGQYAVAWLPWIMLGWVDRVSEHARAGVAQVILKPRPIGRRDGADR